jgi:hypothetical protein
MISSQQTPLWLAVGAEQCDVSINTYDTAFKQIRVLKISLESA